MKKKDNALIFAKELGFDVDQTWRRPEADPDVWDQLTKKPAKMNKDGEMTAPPVPHVDRSNLAIILEGDPQFSTLGYNDHADLMMWGSRILDEPAMTDIMIDLERRYGFRGPDRMIERGVLRVSNQRKIEPIKDWLESLTEWDQYNRIDDMMRDIFHAEFADGYEKLVSTMGRMWLISCVARIMEPGCKVDTAITLIGEKGARKGTALETLASAPWFSNSHIDIKTKAGYELLHQSGVWIWELAEGKALQGKSAEAVKAFMTGQFDRYRPAYRKDIVRRKRRTVFAVTLNNYQFLSDGPERRFWPVRIKRESRIDTDWLMEHRDQIWAEALHYYRQKEKWHLPEDLETQLREYQQIFIIDDPWANQVIECFKKTGKCTTAEIMKDIELPAAQQHSGNSRRIAQICKDLGYVQRMDNGKRTWRKA